MTAQPASHSRTPGAPGTPDTLSVSVREARMSVDRILLTLGVPSGYVHGVRESILLSQALGLGGFGHLLENHAALRMDEFEAMQVQEDSDGALSIDGKGIHSWLLLPTLTDLAVDIARKTGSAAVRVSGVAEMPELRVVTALAHRYGASAGVSVQPAKSGAALEAVISMHNAAPPRNAEQWDPLLFAAMKHGYPVEASLWRAVHALSNNALAPDSVVSRRHAGPVILQDDGTVLGRHPADDDFDINMLRKVAAQPK